MNAKSKGKEKQFSALVATQEPWAFIITFIFTSLTWPTGATAWMIYYALQSQRGSLLWREGNKHFSSPVRSVAGCGPAHSLWAFLSWGWTADCAWWHSPTPQGSLLRKAALGSPEAPGLGVRLEFGAQLYDSGSVHRNFLSLGLLQQAIVQGDLVSW